MAKFDILVEVLTYFIGFVVVSFILGIVLLWLTEKVSKL
jgi:hypothetical protein